MGTKGNFFSAIYYGPIETRVEQVPMCTVRGGCVLGLVKATSASAYITIQQLQLHSALGYMAAMSYVEDSIN